MDVSPFDEDNEGEISIAEPSDVERRMAPKAPEAPSVKTFETDENFGSASDVDSATLRAFGASVIYANVALFCLALGPMLYFFEGWTTTGPVVFVVGTLAAIRTYQVYREWKLQKEGREETDGDDAEVDIDGDGVEDADVEVDTEDVEVDTEDVEVDTEDVEADEDDRIPTERGGSAGPEA